MLHLGVRDSSEDIRPNKIHISFLWKKKQKRQELVEILLHYLLAYQLLLLKVVYAALLSQVFKHVTERIKKLTIFRVLIKVLKKSIYVYFLLS